MRTRMYGGVGGAELEAPPYPDLQSLDSADMEKFLPPQAFELVC
jgi:hypothetical protein